MSEENKIEEKNKNTTYFEKNPRVCPVCGLEFYHEQLLTGGGRLIAGKLRNDLRRTYEKTNKFGSIYPLIYVIVVCPDCFYAAQSEDFDLIDRKKIDEARKEKAFRQNYSRTIFEDKLDFTENRTLTTGAASYFLAMASYYWHTVDVFPTFKKAVSALRLSWTLEDLAEERPGKNFDKLIPFFQFKAKDFYNTALEYMQTGKEHAEKLKSFGPDLDKNYGFEGMLYITALLTSDFSFFIKSPEIRGAELLKAKRTVSKIFGSGKSSKNKPSVLLDNVRELYNGINEQIDDLSKKFGIDIQ